MSGNEPERLRDPSTEASSAVQSFTVQAIPAADAPARKRLSRPRRREVPTMPTATREASGKRMPEDEPTPDAVAGIPACVAGNEQSKFPTSTPSTLLGLLLLELEQNTARIRGELPGWYPLRLVPLLEDVRSTVRRADCRLDQLDARAAQLTEVLRERPETEHIARVLERATTSPDRAMRPMSELPDTISLPDRVRNECEVLAQKIIQALKEPDRAPSGERTTGTSADPAPGNRRP